MKRKNGLSILKKCSKKKRIPEKKKVLMKKIREIKEVCPQKTVSRNDLRKNHRKTPVTIHKKMKINLLKCKKYKKIGEIG